MYGLIQYKQKKSLKLIKKHSNKILYIILGIVLAKGGDVIFTTFEQKASFKKALNQPFTYREHTKTDNIRHDILFTKNLRSKKRESKIVFISSMDCFKYSGWFSHGSDIDILNRMTSSMVIYEYTLS